MHQSCLEPLSRCTYIPLFNHPHPHTLYTHYSNTHHTTHKPIPDFAWRECGNCHVKTCSSHGWNFPVQIFRRAGRMLPKVTVLDLEDVSPKLLKAADLVLTVPGTYAANTPVVTIKSFDSTLQVIVSKQRPRKIWLRGSDGQRSVRVSPCVDTSFALLLPVCTWVCS